MFFPIRMIRSQERQIGIAFFLDRSAVSDCKATISLSVASKLFKNGIFAIDGMVQPFLGGLHVAG